MQSEQIAFVSIVALLAIVFASKHRMFGGCMKQKHEQYYTSPLEAGGPPIFVPDSWPDDTRFGRRVPPTI